MNKKMLSICLLICSFTSISHGDWLNPESNRANLYFENQATQNDVRIGYSISNSINPQLQFVRNHRTNYIELHYAYLKTNLLIVDDEFQSNKLKVSLLPGLGMANKLSGFNRFSYTYGYFVKFYSNKFYFDQTSFAYMAEEFDDKISIQARGGLKIDEISNSSLWFLMSALKETYNTHNITWGPIIRLNNKSSMLDFYATVKGDWGFTFAFEY